MKKRRGYTKLVVLVLTLITFFSVVMGATYSWFYNTNKVNTFQGTATYSATLTLFEKKPDGSILENPPVIPGAEFYLFKVKKISETKDSKDEQCGGKYVSDMKGTISVKDIKQGDYYFLETNPTLRHEYDKNEEENYIKKYHFTVNKETVDENNHIDVIAYNRQKVADLIVSKTVVNKDGTALIEEQMNQEFIFDVDFSIKDNYQYTIDNGISQSIVNDKIVLKHGQKAIIKDIPIGTLYSVRERLVDNYDIISSNHQGNIKVSENKVEYKNTYFKDDTPEGNTILKVLKRVEGLGADKEKEFKFIITINGIQQQFTLKDQEVKEFIVPNGLLYEVIEEDIGNEYSQSIITNGYGTTVGETIQVIKTNTYIGLGKTDVHIKKTWDVPNGVVLPESITIKVKDGEFVVNQKEIKSTDNWEYTFKDLQRYTADGKEIVYTVIEDAIDGYQTIINGYNIINKYIQPLTVATPIIIKEIKAKDIKPNKKTDFIFNITPLDNAPMPEFSSITITGEGQNSFGEISFSDIGIYSYKISEADGNEEGYAFDNSEYTLTYTVTKNAGVLSARQTLRKNNKIVSNVKFVNTYDKTLPPRDETTSLSVTKSWSHGTNKNLPTEVSVQLYKNGTAYGSPTILNKNNNWSKVFIGLSKSNIWTVDEVSEIDGYEKMVVKKANGIYEIINTHESAPEDPKLGVMTLSGTKTWKHNGNKNIPASITIYIKSSHGISKELIVTEKANWTWLETLAIYDKQGKIINYYIEEAPVKNYKTSIDGYDIVNTYITSEPKTEDQTIISLWVALLIGSVMSFILILSSKRGKKDKSIER